MVVVGGGVQELESQRISKLCMGSLLQSGTAVTQHILRQLAQRSTSLSRRANSQVAGGVEVEMQQQQQCADGVDCSEYTEARKPHGEERGWRTVEEGWKGIRDGGWRGKELKRRRANERDD